MPPPLPLATDCTWDRSPTTCLGLELDLQASTAELCEARCCADATCDKWEFGVGNAGCHRGPAANCSVLHTAGTLYAMGRRFNGSLVPTESTPDGLGLGGSAGDAGSSPGVPSLPPTAASSADSVSVSSAGLRLEVVIMAMCIGLALVVAMVGCGCYRFYDQSNNHRRVHPLTVEARKRKEALRAAEEAALQRAIAPKVHAYPQLSSGVYADLSATPGGDGGFVPPPPTANPESDDAASDTTSSREALGSAGRWAKQQMSQRNGLNRAAPLHDLAIDDVTDEPVDEASRPVSAGDVDVHEAVADNEAASAEGTAPAAAPTPGGAEQDDDEFPAPSPYPSPPATGSRPGTASSTSSRGVSKAPRDVLVRRQH